MKRREWEALYTPEPAINAGFELWRLHRASGSSMTSGSRMSCSPRDFPPETVGELVVLWTEEKSSMGMVVSAYRGIDAGDKVQGE